LNPEAVLKPLHRGFPSPQKGGPKCPPKGWNQKLRFRRGRFRVRFRRRGRRRRVVAVVVVVVFIFVCSSFCLRFRLSVRLFVFLSFVPSPESFLDFVVSRVPVHLDTHAIQNSKQKQYLHKSPLGCLRPTRRHRALLIKAGGFAMPQPSFELEPKALHLLRLVSLDVPDYMHVVTCLGAITH
jgi:hypothetical protein